MANMRQKKKENQNKIKANQEKIKFSQNRAKQFKAMNKWAKTLNSLGNTGGKRSEIAKEIEYLGNLLGKAYDRTYMTKMKLERQKLREENKNLRQENKMLNAKIQGLSDAKKEIKKNWTDSQQRVAQAIAAMQRYHGKQFHQSYYTSGELLDIYDKIYDRNEDIPEALTNDEIEQINKGLSQNGIYVRRSEEPKEEENSMVNRILQRAKEMGIFTPKK